jgi:hypothetical protein
MKRNPVVATRRKGRISVPAHIPDRKLHYTAASTKIAQNAVDEVLRGNSKLLGSGNFGVAYEVFSDGRKRLVKMGSFETVHSRGYAQHAKKTEDAAMRRDLEDMAQKSRRTKGQMRQDLLHEAGIANELWAAGFRCIPFTVFVERGLPALVREYGELSGHASQAQLDTLSLDLLDITDAGWYVQDDLLIAKRIYDEDGAPKGSLFIADVGIWQWRGRPMDYQDARSFFHLLMTAFGFPSLAELRYYEQRVREDAEKLSQKPENKLLAWNLDSSQKQLQKIKEKRSPG